MDEMGAVTFRRATRDDVPAIVALLADDMLGSIRESPEDLAPYLAAFEAIDANPHQLLVVAERAGRIVGTAELSFTVGLSHRGVRRATIEAVRVHRDERGAGLGARLIAWCLDEAQRRGSGMVQLTSSAGRVDAHRFWKRLGFEQSHLGFKLRLPRA